MFELENRKKITKNIVDRSTNILKRIISKKYAGLMVVSFHYFLIMLPIVYIYFGKANNIYFYVSVLFFTLVILFHYYFGGCILTRLERELLESSKWYGPPGILLYGSDGFNKRGALGMIHVVSVWTVINIVLQTYFGVSLWFMPLIVVLIFRNPPQY